MLMMINYNSLQVNKILLSTMPCRLISSTATSATNKKENDKAPISIDNQTTALVPIDEEVSKRIAPYSVSDYNPVFLSRPTTKRVNDILLLRSKITPEEVTLYMKKKWGWVYEIEFNYSKPSYNAEYLDKLSQNSDKLNQNSDNLNQNSDNLDQLSPNIAKLSLNSDKLSQNSAKLSQNSDKLGLIAVPQVKLIKNTDIISKLTPEFCH